MTLDADAGSFMRIKRGYLVGLTCVCQCGACADCGGPRGVPLSTHTHPWRRVRRTSHARVPVACACALRAVRGAVQYILYI